MPFFKAVTGRIEAQYGLTRDCVLLNTSHTHSGPAVSRNAESRPGQAGAAENRRGQASAELVAYSRELEDKMVEVVGNALKNSAPARLTFLQSNASFGVNRRQDEGRKWGPNYLAPADHDVPILRVDSEAGDIRALMFGFGCHPSSLLPQNRLFHGDYAGVAARTLEDRHRGAVALFVQGAGGDVKPFPAGTLELTELYGKTLAASVELRLLEGSITAEPKGESASVNGPLATTFETFPLAYDVPTREQLKELLQSGKPNERSNATRLLAVLDSGGKLPADYPYPLTVWQFGRDLTLVGMGGEVLSDYALRLKRELSGTPLWVAGYCHETFGYIPSRRVRLEGGYEAGRWAPTLEETIVGKVHELVKRVRS
jgi:hypothetical protein